MSNLRVEDESYDSTNTEFHLKLKKKCLHFYDYLKFWPICKPWPVLCGWVGALGWNWVGVFFTFQFFPIGVWLILFLFQRFQLSGETIYKLFFQPFNIGTHISKIDAKIDLFGKNIKIRPQIAIFNTLES